MIHGKTMACYALTATTTTTMKMRMTRVHKMMTLKMTSPLNDEGEIVLVTAPKSILERETEMETDLHVTSLIQRKTPPMDGTTSRS